ncbi:hypothetical protein [Mammaliicoccus sciuri]|uniref:hypothetical protein n=1 Tax=Mammaliicoccus sciuri TaxID=1296 RepID=UPI0037922CDF
MWILILIVIACVLFTKRKGTSMVEWIRALPTVVRVGIFTGIMGALLSVIAKPFTTDAYGGQIDSFSLFSIVEFIGSGLIVISALCFLYIFVLWLIALLFG